MKNVKTRKVNTKNHIPVSAQCQWRSQPDIWSCNFFYVYKPYKESISIEMNNDDLNLHSMTKLSGRLRY